MSATKLEPTHSELQQQIQNREQTFDAFRRWGYLQAQLDPLGQYLRVEPIPELDLDGDDADEARSYYCGTIAAEFMHHLCNRRGLVVAGDEHRHTPVGLAAALPLKGPSASVLRLRHRIVGRSLCIM